MGRWTQYDEDDYRLPEGMKRVGYDADTQRYTFQQGQNGGLYVGAPGARFGEMTRASAVPASSQSVGNASHEDDLESSGTIRRDGYMPLPAGDANSIPDGSNNGAYRTLLPFFLIILVFLLLVIRLTATSSPHFTPPPPCPAESQPHEVKSRDSCWAISQEYGTSLEVLQGLNPKVDCKVLRSGQWVCVPLVN